MSPAAHAATFPLYPLVPYIYVTSAAEANVLLAPILPGAVIGLDVESVLSLSEGKTKGERKALRRAHADKIEKGSFAVAWDTMLLRLIQVAYEDNPVYVLDLQAMRCAFSRFYAAPDRLPVL